MSAAYPIASRPYPGPRIGGDDEGRKVVERRHAEWAAYETLWRRLLDSYEGGDAYRNGVYGEEIYGGRSFPRHNLIRHRREYPLPAEDGDAFARSGDASAPVDEYEIRRYRTPVPRFVHGAVIKHVSTIYGEGVDRKGPKEYDAWMADADGAGRPLSDWFRDEVAPFLLLLGTIDVSFDRPRVPPGAVVESKADERALKLDRVVASVVLPTNVLWWRAHPTRPGEYAEVLIREWHDDEEGRPAPYYRRWTTETVTLYDYQGEEAEPEADHGLGFVPVMRHVLTRRPGRSCVGMGPYEGVLEQEREYYNCDSESILSATFHAHPTLQGPKNQMRAEGTIAVGPQWSLPIGEASNGAPISWSYIQPPTDPIEALRAANKDRVDLMFAMTGQTKPAGVAAGGDNPVSQSGVSKELDQKSGNEILGSLAAKLADCEAKAGRFAVAVARRVPPSRVEAVSVTYPSGFNLYSAADMADFADKFSAWLAVAGACPEAEKKIGSTWFRKAVPGMDDAEYDRYDAAIAECIDAATGRKEQAAEAFAVGLTSPDPDTDPRSSPDGAEPPGGPEGNP